jgi:nucleotide-binding universal stress UspA family protein
MSTYRSILCATDFSAPSRVALTSAAELAVQFDSALTLVHVYQLPVFGTPEAGPGSPFRVAVKDLAAREMGEWKREAEQLARRHVAVVCLEGVAWDLIVRYAHDHAHDLTVVGTHGRTGIQHMLLGSVAERIVRHATCPVLVVREPRA